MEDNRAVYTTVCRGRGDCVAKKKAWTRRCFPKVAGLLRWWTRGIEGPGPAGWEERARSLKEEKVGKASRSMPKVIAQSRPLALGRCHVTESIGCQSSPWDLQMVTEALHWQQQPLRNDGPALDGSGSGLRGRTARWWWPLKLLRKTFGPFSLSHWRPS